MVALASPRASLRIGQSIDLWRAKMFNVWGTTAWVAMANY